MRSFTQQMNREAESHGKGIDYGAAPPCRAGIASRTGTSGRLFREPRRKNARGGACGCGRRAGSNFRASRRAFKGRQTSQGDQQAWRRRGQYRFGLLSGGGDRCHHCSERKQPFGGGARPDHDAGPLQKADPDHQRLPGDWVFREKHDGGGRVHRKNGRNYRPWEDRAPSCPHGDACIRRKGNRLRSIPDASARRGRADRRS